MENTEIQPPPSPTPPRADHLSRFTFQVIVFQSYQTDIFFSFSWHNLLKTVTNLKWLTYVQSAFMDLIASHPKSPLIPDLLIISIFPGRIIIFVHIWIYIYMYSIKV